jgi:hypothetical protein
MSDGNRHLDRRQFLALGGAATAALAGGGYALTRRASADASTALRSYNGGTVKNGLVRYRSRPDLIAPHVTIDTPRAGARGALVVTEVHDGDSQSGPLIINQSGDIVWFLPLSPQPSTEHRAFNVQVTEYQGKPVLAWFQGAVVAGHGQGSYLIVDESYNQIAEVQGQNGLQGDLHELVLTPQGTALFTAYGTAQTTMDVNGTSQNVSYWYGVVQEVDIASGNLLFEWRSDDHVPVSDSYVDPTVLFGGSWDYFHINAISIDPTDGNLVISGRNTWACYKVDRNTGDVIWQLGGKNNGFSMGPGTGFAFQHDVKLHPGGLMSIFDNEGGPPQQASQSRGLLLNIDEANRSVTLKQAFTHKPPVYSSALGSVQPLSGGRWFMGWGRSTYFTEYDRNGKVLFDGHLSGNGSSYRAFLQDWQGTPTVPPAIAVTRHGGGSTVFASWNGATALARWIVHGGSSPHTLAPLGNAQSVGFETGITLPSAPAYVSVSACNSAGHVLATSKPIQVP